jgi:hypothetical protein
MIGCREKKRNRKNTGIPPKYYGFCKRSACFVHGGCEFAIAFCGLHDRINAAAKKKGDLYAAVGYQAL